MTKVIMIILGIAILVGLIMGIRTGGAKKRAEKKAKKLGDKYESLVAREIEQTFNIKPARNLIIHDGNHKTEVDMAFATKKGVFSIECKYHDPYAYYIRATNSGGSWELWGDGGYNIPIDNPLIQNDHHVKYLYKYLGVENIYNIIYSSARITFSFFGNISQTEKEPFVNHLESGFSIIQETGKGKGTKQFKKALDKLPDVFTDAQVKEINTLLNQAQADIQARADHAEYAKNARLR